MDMRLSSIDVQLVSSILCVLVIKLVYMDFMDFRVGGWQPVSPYGGRVKLLKVTSQAPNLDPGGLEDWRLRRLETWRLGVDCGGWQMGGCQMGSIRGMGGCFDTVDAQRGRLFVL